jgi:hypothetical protein
MKALVPSNLKQQPATEITALTEITKTPEITKITKESLSLPLAGIFFAILKLCVTEESSEHQ